ncbi:MAG: hypothetical protein WDN10_00190 [bacterium]
MDTQRYETLVTGYKEMKGVLSFLAAVVTRTKPDGDEPKVNLSGEALRKFYKLKILDKKKGRGTPATTDLMDILVEVLPRRPNLSRRQKDCLDAVCGGSAAIIAHHLPMPPVQIN